MLSGIGKTLCVAACVCSVQSISYGQVTGASNGGNALLHAIGFQSFDAGTGGVADTTPDSNSTFDLTPVGSNNNGSYLSAIIGPGASILGRDGFGVSGNTSFLQGATFGDAPTAGNPGLNIVDVPLANGSPGARVDLQGQPGATSWNFDGNQASGDFSITNESDFYFRLEDIHFDARSANANGPSNLDLLYLNAGASNLVRADNGNEVQNLQNFASVTFPSSEALTAVNNVSAALPAGVFPATALRLAPGDTASFRFLFSNSITNGAQSQIDNLAFSGTFQDQNNGFALIDPVAVSAIPEPNSLLLLAAGCAFSALRRRRT